MTELKGAQSLPKRHHYIPQFYLKGFSSDGKHLFVLDKKHLNKKDSDIRQ